MRSDNLVFVDLCFDSLFLRCNIVFLNLTLFSNILNLLDLND